MVSQTVIEIKCAYTQSQNIEQERKKVVKEEELIADVSSDNLEEDISSASTVIVSTSLEKYSICT